MAQTLSLQFTNEEGRTVSLTLDSPIVPADPEQVESVMNTILARNIFTSTGGSLISKKGAQIVDREVTIIDLPSL